MFGALNLEIRHTRSTYCVNVYNTLLFPIINFEIDKLILFLGVKMCQSQSLINAKCKMGGRHFSQHFYQTYVSPSSPPKIVRRRNVGLCSG